MKPFVCEMREYKEADDPSENEISVSSFKFPSHESNPIGVSIGDNTYATPF